MANDTGSPTRLASTNHPLLYELNIRVLLRELSEQQGSPVTLENVPDALLDDWAKCGFDAVWPMGIWTAGELGRRIAREHQGLQEEYRRALPDFSLDDVVASPYAVQKYEVPASLGGDRGLRRFRERLHERGIGLILDFVANHTARDHAWTRTHPEYYIQGLPGEDREKPEWFFQAETDAGPRVLAYGRDPFFPGWTDTAQLNYQMPALRKAVIDELCDVASKCDGLRCDMAMLLLRDIFLKDWTEYAAKVGEEIREEFWPAAIGAARKVRPGLIFMAEAYWNMEWTLQQLGFDYTYDKILYDRLLREGAGAVRDHLRAGLDYQRRCVRFIENHDEQPAAAAFASEAWHFAAAVVAATVPGMFMVHDGQLEGRTVRIPVQLRRRPRVQPNERTHGFYHALMQVLNDPVFRTGEWRQLAPKPAWHDNQTWQNFVVFWWHHPDRGSRLVVVNYAPRSGQCFVDLPLDLFASHALRFRDLMGPSLYVRDRTILNSRGMYFDLSPYGFHIFDVTPVQR